MRRSTSVWGGLCRNFQQGGQAKPHQEGSLLKCAPSGDSYMKGSGGTGYPPRWLWYEGVTSKTGGKPRGGWVLEARRGKAYQGGESTLSEAAHGSHKMMAEWWGQRWPWHGQAWSLSREWMEWAYERMGKRDLKRAQAALHGVLPQKSTEKPDSGWWESGSRGLLRMGEWEHVLKMTTMTTRSFEEQERFSPQLVMWLTCPSLVSISVCVRHLRKGFCNHLFWHECPFVPKFLYLRPLCVSFMCLPRAAEFKLREGRVLILSTRCRGASHGAGAWRLGLFNLLNEWTKEWNDAQMRSFFF